MNDKNLHIKNIEEKSAEFFSKGKINWEKQENEVWSEMISKTKSRNQLKKVSMFRPLMKYAAAAVIFLVVGFGAVIFLYQESVESFPGEHVTAELPDGSVVEMNAGSSLKYYPLKWKFERKVIFDGEGYFSVQKGNRFRVQSLNGNTEVLGTTFNIYSRDEKYRVTCFTGSVKVATDKEIPLVIESGDHVELQKGKLVLSDNIEAEDILSWKNNRFFFSGTPLKEVIDEIERQYGVTIKIQSELFNRNFAGNFPKKYNVEEVLDFVCKTMQVNFVKQSENVFLVTEKS